MGVIHSKTAISEQHYRFWAAIASSLRLGWLGIKDKAKEVKAARLMLFPLLMCTAAMQGDIVALEEHIQVGADATIYDYGGRTPLHLAAGEGDLDTVKFLLKKGADFNARDRNNCPPLRDAIRARNVEVSQFLMKEGSHLITSPGELGGELCCVAFMNDIKQMEAWIAAGVQVNYTDYDARTPLHVAVCTNLPEMVVFLLNNGSDTELRDRYNNRPIDDSRRLGFTHIEKLFTPETKTKGES